MKKIQYIIIISLLFNLYGYGQAVTKNVEKQNVKIVGHAHMDPVYRWRWNEMESREISKTFTDVLSVLDKYPDLRFAQSYMLYYSIIQKNFPILFERVKQSITDKKWNVVGGQWVEPDETLPSGESLIRQFLIANDYYTKNLDIKNINIAWSPDAFTGHLVTIPKIYAGCGIQSYVFSRGAPEGKKVFWWESKDGSKILAYKIPGHYNPDFEKLPAIIETWKQEAKYDSPFMTFGKGDHGGGPDDQDIESLKILETESFLEFEHLLPENYFQELHASGNSWPVQKEEFGITPNTGRWKGCYTSQTMIKKKNRFFENQLITAEKFSAIGTMHKGKPFYPREDFLEAWRILLFNQFHDILPGTLTGLCVNDVMRDYKRLEEITSEQLNAGIENIGARINTEMDGIPLVVYNPHSWSVNQLVEAEIKFLKNHGEFKLKDSAGNNIPYSIIGNSNDELSYNICLEANSIPPFGYKVFEVVEEALPKNKSDLILNNNSIENSHYIIEWDENGLVSIFSKKLQKEFLNGSANKLELLEDNGNSWGLGYTGNEFEIKQLSKPEIIYSSPLKITVKWEDYFQSSKFTRYMSVKSNSDQIDFEMEVDWHSANKILRLSFPSNVSDGDAYFDQPYGYVKREDSKWDTPAQKWIDYSNSSYGVSLINNGKYGFNIKEGVLGISVVRGARGMDPRMDEGKHSFKYSLIIHEGDWRNADIPLRAWEFNQPLVAKQENQHPGKISGWAYSKESFPLEKSFFSIKSDHVIISSLKIKQDAYNPNPLILRIVETEGRDEYISVKLPYNTISIKECNHIEQEIETQSEINVNEKQFSFMMGHDQIRTFMIQFE